MSILSALNTGAGGLDASSVELSVIGDNIANANTIGFKSSRVVFQDTLAQTLIGEGTSQIGLGTRAQTVQRLHTQGALLTTNRATDLSLEGSGYFVVSGSYNGTAGTFYTRAGQFTLDKDGYLVNLQGLRVQGYAADSAGVVANTVGDLRVNSGAAPPQPTGNVTLRANLSADAPVIAAAWDPANPDDTSNFSSSVVVYDTLGAAHTVDVYYRKTAAGAWEWHAMTDGAGVTGGTAGTPSEIATGTLTFDSEGRLATVGAQSGTFNPINATNPQAIAFNFGTSTGAGGTGLDGVTQFSSASVTTFTSQDGFTTGNLTNVNVDSQGQVVGVFTNGQTRVLGQVAVAEVPSEEHLHRMGGNLFSLMPEAGSPTLGRPGAGGRASVIAGTLEQSNVDMAAEMVRMIAAQRAFQANSKTITTADQLLAELMTLKR